MNKEDIKLAILKSMCSLITKQMFDRGFPTKISFPEGSKTINHGRISAAITNFIKFVASNSESEFELGGASMSFNNQNSDLIISYKNSIKKIKNSRFLDYMESESMNSRSFALHHLLLHLGMYYLFAKDVTSDDFIIKKVIREEADPYYFDIGYNFLEEVVEPMWVFEELTQDEKHSAALMFQYFMVVLFSKMSKEGWTLTESNTLERAKPYFTDLFEKIISSNGKMLYCGEDRIYANSFISNGRIIPLNFLSSFGSSPYINMTLGSNPNIAYIFGKGCFSGSITPMSQLCEAFSQQCYPFTNGRDISHDFKFMKSDMLKNLDIQVIGDKTAEYLNLCRPKNGNSNVFILFYWNLLTAIQLINPLTYFFAKGNIFYTSESFGDIQCRKTFNASDIRFSLRKSDILNVEKISEQLDEIVRIVNE